MSSNKNRSWLLIIYWDLNDTLFNNPNFPIIFNIQKDLNCMNLLLIKSE
jgi:hypothetical protein